MKVFAPRNRGGSSSPLFQVKLLHRDCLIAHYWLSCLQHTFLLWPLEAPSSLCVTSSLSRWSWRSYSHSMKWSLNFSTGTTWTRREKMQMPRSQWRKRGERRRGIRPPHQVRGITLRSDNRWGISAKKLFPLVPLDVEQEHQICGDRRLFNLSEGIQVQLSPTLRGCCCCCCWSWGRSSGNGAISEKCNLTSKLIWRYGWNNIFILLQIKYVLSYKSPLSCMKLCNRSTHSFSAIRWQPLLCKKPMMIIAALLPEKVAIENPQKASVVEPGLSQVWSTQHCLWRAKCHNAARYICPWGYWLPRYRKNLCTDPAKFTS